MRAIPPGIPRVNWNDPLTFGLTACYLPSAHYGGSFVYNLAGDGLDLALESSAAYASTVEGGGLATVVPDVSGAQAPLPSRYQYTDCVSLYWRGLHNGTAANGGSTFIGASWATFPYAEYVIGPALLTDVGNVSLMWNTDNNQFVTAAAAMPIGAIGSYGGTFQVGGNVVFYVSGEVFDTQTFGALPPFYDPTSTMAINWTASPPGTGLEVNATALISLVWHRVLTPSEMALIHLDPYRFLIFPRERRRSGKLPAPTRKASVDGILALTNLQKSASIDAVLKKTRTLFASADSLLFKTGTRTAVMGALLRRTVTKTASLDGRLFKSSPFTTLDGILQKTMPTTASLDATLTQSFQVRTSLTLSISISSSTSSAMDAIILPVISNHKNRITTIPEMPRTVDVAY